ncbi:hypothetical protein B7463_g73, partial [Scytalidium lignicola]
MWDNRVMESTWQSQHLESGIRMITGGSGTPVVLVPGWPETAEAYSDLFMALSKDHRFFVLDPPGLGESSPSTTGYDTGEISKILAESLHKVIQEPYHLVGHDVGSWIVYPWAAQFPSRIKSLTILDGAIPGLGPRLPYPLPFEANIKLWQFSFNALPELPEILTQGRERELLTWIFKHKTEHPEKFPQTRIEHYIQNYAKPGAMSRGFEYYRAVAKSSEQNVEFAKIKLEMPVLAFGGKSSAGGSILAIANIVADDVQGGVIEDCGHFVMEEQPEYLAERLVNFFKDVESRIH